MRAFNSSGVELPSVMLLFVSLCLPPLGVRLAESRRDGPSSFPNTSWKSRREDLAISKTKDLVTTTWVSQYQLPGLLLVSVLEVGIYEAPTGYTIMHLVVLGERHPPALNKVIV